MDRRIFRTLALTLLGCGLVAGRCLGQGDDPARAKTLTVEQAQELVKRPNAIRLSVLELSPDVAAVLGGYKGDVRFEALAALTPEAAALLAAIPGGLDLPKLTALPPAVAKALAAHKGRLSVGVNAITLEAAEALTTHAGVLDLGVTDITAESAAALARHPGPLALNNLRALTSLPLAERLGQQEYVSLGGVSSISAEIAKALCPPENRVKFKNHVHFAAGLTELPADTAAAIMAGRTHIFLGNLSSISDEAAEAWAGPFCNVRLFGLKTLTPAAAAALTKGSGIMDIRLFGPELSAETAAAIAKQITTGPARMIDLNGLKKLSSPELALAALRRYRQGPHSSLNGVVEVTEEVAKAIAECKENLSPLPGLGALTSAPMAAKYAAQPDDLIFRKLGFISDDVALALATHKGKIDLSALQSLSAVAAKAFAGHEGELRLDGLKEITDEAAAALAPAPGPVSLAGLAQASPAAVTALKANPKIALPAKLATP